MTKPGQGPATDAEATFAWWLVDAANAVPVDATDAVRQVLAASDGEDVVVSAVTQGEQVRMVTVRVADGVAEVV